MDTPALFRTSELTELQSLVQLPARFQSPLICICRKSWSCSEWINSIVKEVEIVERVEVGSLSSC